jgi:hypothetical protein
MRVDARTNSKAKYFDAFLNGENVSADCVAADDSEGWVELLERNEDETPKVIRTGRGHDIRLVTKRIFGDVQIKPIEGFIPDDLRVVYET